MQTPSLVDLPTSDGRGDSSLELGIRFTANAPGRLTALRFYKDSLETGTHVGRIWDSLGNQIAAVTFDSETASGWQVATLSSPVELTVGETYTASVNANAYFVDDRGGLAQEVDAGPIGSVVDQNGVFADGAGTYPTSSFASSNYFVDVVVEDESDATSTDSSTTTSTDSSTTTDTTTEDVTTTDDTTTDDAVTTTADTTTTAAATTTSAATVPTGSGSDASAPPASSATKETAGGTQAPPTFTADVTAASTRSNLPKGSQTPTWPMRVWFDLSSVHSNPARLSFAEDPSKPWAWRPFRNTITVRTRQHSIWVRFADASGAVSDWQRITIN